jgi:hypothetical protein
MEYFVNEDSIVRKIWGKADTILFIFAGASAEFAVNKAVDWLYFTGKLPADPLGRLFSTVAYARQIVFSEYPAAIKSIDKIAAIHKGVEQNRGMQIPDWAYRDVLFMLVDYSIRSFEVLERPLTRDEKSEVFSVFLRVGACMNINGLPADFEQWQLMRKEHLHDNLLRSSFSLDLYKQYRKHLGPVRYLLLKQVQMLVVPEAVKSLLSLGDAGIVRPALSVYKVCRLLKLDTPIKAMLLPQNYKTEINDLDFQGVDNQNSHR